MRRFHIKPPADVRDSDSIQTNVFHRSLWSIVNQINGENHRKVHGVNLPGKLGHEKFKHVRIYISTLSNMLISNEETMFPSMC